MEYSEKRDILKPHNATLKVGALTTNKQRQRKEADIHFNKVLASS